MGIIDDISHTVKHGVDEFTHPAKSVESEIEKRVLGQITGPYQSLRNYVEQTEALGKALENGALSGLKGAAQRTFDSSEDALQTIANDAQNIGKRIAHAAQTDVMKLTALAEKLKELPSLALSSADSIGDRLKLEASRLETGSLSKLHALISDAGNVNYSDALKGMLGEILSSARAVSAQLQIPVSNLALEVVDKISTVLPKLPAEATHIVAGIVKLDELEKALNVLKQVQSDKKIINVERKTLIVTSASLSAIAKMLKSAGTILPMTVSAEGEAGVGADERGGVGLAGGPRAAGEGAVGEEGNVGGGTTLVKVGKFVCNPLAIILEGIASLLDQLQLHIPVKQEA